MQGHSDKCTVSERTQSQPRTSEADERISLQRKPGLGEQNGHLLALSLTPRWWGGSLTGTGWGTEGLEGKSCLRLLLFLWPQTTLGLLS